MLLLGFEMINLKDNKLTHKLPTKKRVAIETVKNDGGTLGASNNMAEPTTHISVKGNNTNPKGMVTHLGNGLGSTDSGSIVRLTIHSSRAAVWRRMAVLVSAHGTRRRLIDVTS